MDSKVQGRNHFDKADYFEVDVPAFNEKAIASGDARAIAFLCKRFLLKRKSVLGTG